MEIELGKKYKDSFSGWVGIAAARHEYYNGCIRYTLEGTNQDNQPQAFVFDEEQIVELDDKPVSATSSHGGPKDHASISRH